MDTEYTQITTSNRTNWTSYFRQVLVCFILWTSNINTGLGMGTPTVAIPQLRKEANSTAAVSNEMASWLTSTQAYSASISLFIIIPFGHFMGRKITMAVLSVTTLISSALIYFSKTALHLLISQFIMGIASAGQCSVFLLILSEYSSPIYRGVFLTLKSAMFSWGMWIANTIGIFMDYNYIGIVGMFCSTTSFIIALVIPESPYWLAFRGRYDECAVAHRWLKGVTANAEEELNVLIKSQKEINKNVESVKSLGKYLKTCLTAIRKPEIFKPLLLCCLVSSINIFSGKLVCAVYVNEMMKKFTTNPSTVFIGILILDGFTVLGMYVGCGLSKIFKRRTLLLSTSITETSFLFAMSIYLYLIKLSVLPENDFVIITMLVGYSVAVCCGPMILAATIPAELLPVRFRSFCVFIFSLFDLIIVSTTVKVSPYVFSSVGFHGVYLGFAICSTILISLMYMYVPETKDRTIHEIAAIFKQKEKREVTDKALTE